MSKVAFGLALAAALIALLPLGPDSTPARAEPGSYEYDVLSGLQPGYEGPTRPQSDRDHVHNKAARRFFTSTNLVMTCGWHWICVSPYTEGGGIDSVITAGVDPHG